MCPYYEEYFKKDRRKGITSQSVNNTRKATYPSTKGGFAGIYILGIDQALIVRSRFLLDE
jgi:hypothetical protein